MSFYAEGYGGINRSAVGCCIPYQGFCFVSFLAYVVNGLED